TEVFETLLDRDSDRAGRVVDDHIVDLGEDRVGDVAKVLDLVARDPVRRARVDVDHRAAFVDDPPCFGRVLLGRVRDRGALVAVCDRPRDRARDDHGVRETAHGSSSLVVDGTTSTYTSSPPTASAARS